jgi:hypothetical protein
MFSPLLPYQKVVLPVDSPTSLVLYIVSVDCIHLSVHLALLLLFLREVQLEDLLVIEISYVIESI